MSLRVLLALHPPEGVNGQFGGPSRRVRATARALAALGVEAVVAYGDEIPDGVFDVAHVHNVWQPEEALKQVRLLRPRCRHLVFSPIYLDLSEFVIGLGLTKLYATSASLDEAAVLHRPMMERLRRVGPGLDDILKMLSPDYRGCLRRILDTVDHVVFLSEHEKAAMTALEPLGGCGGSIVRNAAGIDWIDGADPDAFRRAHGLDRYVLCVGSLEARKNQMTWRRPGGTSRPPGADRRGRGTEIRRTRPAAVAPRLGGARTPGRRCPARLGLCRADAFVLPSLSEGAPLSALEAAAAGTPLALSDRSSEREYFGDLAVYFDPTDPDAIRAAVRAATQRGRDPAHRAALRDFTRRTYSYERLATSLRDLYAALPAGRGDDQSRFSQPLLNRRRRHTDPRAPRREPGSVISARKNPSMSDEKLFVVEPANTPYARRGVADLFKEDHKNLIRVLAPRRKRRGPCACSTSVAPMANALPPEAGVSRLAAFRRRSFGGLHRRRRRRAGTGGDRFFRRLGLRRDRAVGRGDLHRRRRNLHRSGGGSAKAHLPGRAGRPVGRRRTLQPA
jgi:glycosyltransferase involved in cell wall biosynthesis